MDDLLSALVRDRGVVTTDAMFTHIAIAPTILDAGGDYLMAVKENQPTLLEDAIFLFADPDRRMQRAEETRLHGGCIERRTLATLTALVGHSDWPGLAQTLCMERRVTEKERGGRGANGRTPSPRSHPLRYRPRSCSCSGANTGTSRTNCIGCTTSPSAKTTLRCGREPSGKHWRRCAIR